MKKTVTLLTGVLISTGLVLPPPGQNLLPYQVSGWTTSLEQDDDGQRYLLVDLGAGRPADDPSQPWTVLGTSGSSSATLSSVEKTCEFLCGLDEGEECHFVARLSVQAPRDIGRPLIALATDAIVADITVHGAAFDRPPPDWTASWTTPLWWHSRGGADDRPLQFLIKKQAVTSELSYRYGIDTPFGMPMGRCLSRETAGLTEVRCDSAAILARDGVPLLVSMADYNIPSAEVVATVRIDELTYHVVKLGLKAQTIYGLLGPGDEVYFRPRDYALIC